jgi:hypothetical protein
MRFWPRGYKLSTEDLKCDALSLATHETSKGLIAKKEDAYAKRGEEKENNS